MICCNWDELQFCPLSLPIAAGHFDPRLYQLYPEISVPQLAENGNRKQVNKHATGFFFEIFQHHMVLLWTYLRIFKKQN